jgi:hypothetical protein
LQEAGGQQGEGENTTFSALDEDDLQTVIVENKLGCDIFVKKVEHDVDTVDMLRHGDCVSVWIPPPRFSNRLNVADESREARYYVAVQILGAKVMIMMQMDIHNSNRDACFFFLPKTLKSIHFKFCRVYLSLMMVTAITSSVHCVSLLTIRHQSSKSFFPRVQEQSVSSL